MLLALKCSVMPFCSTWWPYKLAMLRIPSASHSILCTTFYHSNDSPRFDLIDIFSSFEHLSSAYEPNLLMTSFCKSSRYTESGWINVAK